MTASTRSPTQRDPWGRVVALGIKQITSWGSMYDLFALLLLAIRWQHRGAH